MNNKEIISYILKLAYYVDPFQEISNLHIDKIILYVVLKEKQINKISFRYKIII